MKLKSEKSIIQIDLLETCKVLTIWNNGKHVQTSMISNDIPNESIFKAFPYVDQYIFNNFKTIEKKKCIK